MKKRFLTFILTIATMLMCMFGFSACGDKVEFKINFVIENEVYATISTSGNEVISMPENPTKDDYTFDGWYWDENTWEKPFTANSLLDAPLSSDMKVYAKFNKNHTHEYTPTTTEPTCKEKGIITYTCTCGDSYTEDISATGEHTWGKGEETKAPTCTREGETTYTCTVCKTATKTEPIDKLPHEHNTEKWTSNATYHWHECECGDKKDEEKHTAGAPATATTPQTCTVCGYVLQVETGILFNTLTVDGTKVYGKVSNTTTEFSFIDEVTVKGNATYVVDNDKDCGSPIYSKTVDLAIGDNTFYVLEMIGNDVKLFTVTIRRRPMYDVTFNANGGTSVQKQVIEEDFLATEPETTRTGYTFTGWDYDFTQAITENTKITASWSANKDTKYTVNYYLQNLDDNNYTLKETVELKGETDTTATAEIKEYTHFTYNESASTISGNINPEGNRVLSVYYTRDSYKIVANNNNAKAGTSTQINGTYKYDKQFTLTATTNTGYTWLGWYDGETCVCEDEEFTFKAEKDVTYTATWSANTDTKYTVNYYLQNLDDNNYTLHESVELEGATDTTATAEIKEYTRFTYNVSKSVVSGNIDGDGGQVLSVYYTRNTYTISVNNTSHGSITNSGNQKYGKEITSTATPYLGYEFIGWYSGGELLSTDSTYTFTVDKNVMAKFAVKAEMSYFNFSTTATTCSITGVKNRAVKEIVVPDYVTSISKGAFSGCSSLKNITIPFVGGSRKTASDTYQYPFGYIFGTSSYTGGTATEQKYYGSSTSSTTSTTYYIPTSLKSVTITGENILPRAFYNCDSLTSVVIPDSVTSIGEYAFSSCDSLTSVVIPDSVTSIGSYAFSSCDSLTSVVIPFGVTSIGWYAFSSCDSLTSVVIGNGVTSIGPYAFHGCSSLTSVVIGDSVTLIGDYAFYWCSSLTSVEIGDSVTSIGYDAFEYCSSLTSVYITDIEAWCNISFADYDANPLYYGANLYLNNELVTELIIPDSVTSIGNYAFEYCSGLTSVTIGNGVTSIAREAFFGCTSLTSVEIGDSVTLIGDYAFEYCSSLTSVYITDIEAWCNISFGKDSANPLYYAENLYLNNELVTELIIPDSVTTIGKYAFRGCDSLTSVEIGDSVTSIGYDAFYNCYKLVEVVNKSTHITVTKGADSNGYVGYYALAVYNSGDVFTSKLSNDNGYIIYTDGNEKILIGYCGMETDLVLPSYITKINQYAFRGCSSLTSVEIGDSVTTIGSYAFYDCYRLVEVVNKSTHITVTKGADSNGYVGCYALAVYNSGDVFTSKLSNDNGYIIYTDGNDKILVGYNGIETDLVLPSYITKINRYAFSSCDSLTSVVIGNSVTTIGDYAFYWCSSLTSVVIGDSVTSIGERAFYNCDSLTSVVIPDSVTTIGEDVFSYCDSLTRVEIGDSVTSIGNYAFYNCSSLTNIVIPDSVTSIGFSAFGGCSSLESITIPFVGGSRKTASDTYQFPFGYIFGTSSYTGGTATEQKYYGSSTSSTTSTTYYIPTSLKSVTITGGNILYGAFYNCSSLTSVVIPDSVTSIGSSAFSACNGLTSVVIGDNVTSIGSYAFYSCDSLTSITFKDTSTWYRTTNYSHWQNKTVGTSTSVTNSSKNATYFKSTYYDYYWYKL